MARKGREPLAEAPPPADSSSSGEESEDDSDETHPSSSDEEEEKTPSPAPQKPSSVKKASTQKKVEPPKPAESESESDSDSDSPPTLKVKPIVSKPMVDFSKIKKPPTPPSSGAPKRPPPFTDNEKGLTKKTKTDKAESSVAPQAQDEAKKVLFQRVWSEEDEIVILKGMIDYKAKKGTDPMADPDDFLEFIKKSLHFVDANKAQFVNKVQRLRKKFENPKRRKINNPHELKVFELSKQIWGSDGVGDNGVGENHNSSLNGKGKASNSTLKAGKGGANGLALEVGKKLESRKKMGEEGDHEVTNWVLSRCEKEMLLGGGSSIGYFNEGILKEGMKLLGEKERAELTEKLRKHNMAEMEVYLKRLDLIQEVAQKAFDALKSSQN